MIEDSSELRSFPLRRRFLRYVIPSLSVVIVALLYIVSQALSTTAERFYERETQVKHQLLIAALAESGALPSLRDLPGAPGNDAVERIRDALRSETAEFEFACTAIRAPDDRLLIAMSPDGCTKSRDELTEELSLAGDSGFMEQGQGTTEWVVASKVRAPSGSDSFLVVTTQSARPLEALIGSTTKAWILALLAVFIVVLAGLTWLIVQAQRQIDLRTNALIEARRSLARFVSRHGQAQARGDQAAARSVHATVLFIDIRDFSSFADAADPEEAAALVEKVAEIAFTEILAAGGDIDRLLGDGLIAWFEGADRKDYAWRAVSNIIPAIASAGLPRSVGAGMHDGEVVEATIGAGERLDHTVLGRTVNIAARLCAAAAPDEVVVSEGFGEPPEDIGAVTTGREQLTLKGIGEAVTCRRFGFVRPG